MVDMVKRSPNARPNTPLVRTSAGRVELRDLRADIGRYMARVSWDR